MAPKAAQSTLLVLGASAAELQRARDIVGDEVQCVSPRGNRVSGDDLTVAHAILLFYPEAGEQAGQLGELLADSDMPPLVFVATSEIGVTMPVPFPPFRGLDAPVDYRYMAGAVHAAHHEMRRLRKIEEEQERLSALYEMSSSLLKITKREQISKVLETYLPTLFNTQMMLLVMPRQTPSLLFYQSLEVMTPDVPAALRKHLSDAWGVLRPHDPVAWDWVQELETADPEFDFLPVTPESFMTAPIAGGGQTEGFFTILQRQTGHTVDEGFLRTFFVIGDLLSVLLQNLDLKEKLEKRATHDGLTALFNRQTLMEHLEKECRRCQRYGGMICVVMMDLDHFKSVNDKYGHQAGDAVLRMVGGKMKANVREVDFVGRCGGEEFIVVLVGTDANGGQVWADRFREIIATTPVPLDGGHVLNVTASLGVAAASGEKATSHEIIAMADAALYRAKHSGRNRVELSDGTRMEASVV